MNNGCKKMVKFIECVLPVKACNLRCDYCYVTQNKWWDSKKPDLKLCVDNIGKALSKERLGGECMINICAQGETLLYPEIVDIARQLLEQGHYLMIVTNATLTKRFELFALMPEELKKRLFFKCSFHYLELKQKGLLESYFANIKMLKEAGISYTVEITPDDSYIPYIDEIKSVCISNLGALCHVTVPRDERLKGFPLMTSLPREEFVKVWRGFDSTLFDFKESIFEIKRKEFCYAGAWSFVFDLCSGDYRQCYRGKVLGNIYSNMEKELKLCAIGNNCPEGHCFNGHAFLGFGLIPELSTPYFADMRNRVLTDGTMWLSEDMKEFMECKLVDANEEYKTGKKTICNIKSYNYKSKLKRILRR